MRRKLAEIKTLVKAQKESGQSVPEFCAEHGLEEKTFYVWRQRASQPQPERFVRVNGERRVELELRGGIIVRVSPEDVKAVVEALK